MEKVGGFFEEIKGWLYICSLIILFLNLFITVMPQWLVMFATGSAFILFVWDIVVIIIGVVSSIYNSEWSFCGIVSLVIEVVCLVGTILLWAMPEGLFNSLGIIKEIEGQFVWVWTATCMIIFHYACEILSLPTNLIAVCSDDGDYD